MYTYEDLIKRIAVRIETEDEFDSWVGYCKSHGHFVRNDDFRYYLKECEEKIAFDICPHLNDQRCMTWSDLDWYEGEGYKIINFSDLVDLGKIEIDMASYESMLFE